MPHLSLETSYCRKIPTPSECVITGKGYSHLQSSAASDYIGMMNDSQPDIMSILFSHVKDDSLIEIPYNAKILSSNFDDHCVRDFIEYSTDDLFLQSKGVYYFSSKSILFHKETQENVANATVPLEEGVQKLAEFLTKSIASSNNSCDAFFSPLLDRHLSV